MATVNMDRLLDACVTMGASDIHLTTNRSPVLRIDGGLRNLETKVLEPDDTESLMRAITPDRNQQELRKRVEPTSVLPLATRAGFVYRYSGRKATLHSFFVLFRPKL